MDQQEPEHSPLGGSSAERWMNCPGSNVLLKKLNLPETDEQDYRRDGIAAHEVGAFCLQRECDTWETIGQEFHGVTVDPEMGDAVQVYLDHVRSLMIPNATQYIEQPLGDDPATRPHPLFYGRLDFGQYATDVIDVVDYKHGEGIVVEPDDNPQMKYYAYGLLIPRLAKGVQIRSDRLVRLHIVQPRAFHLDGPVRTWETTVGEIVYWAENELIPAMELAEIDSTLDPGKWCRFCPAKLFCPMLQGLFGAAAKADPNMVPNFGQTRMGLEYQQIEAVNFYIKALKDEVLRRNMLGNTVPGTKLVKKKSDRVWKADGLKLIPQRFGEKGMTKPEVMSPAQLEKLGPEAKKFVAEYAYHPDTGLTVALESDRKQAVIVDKAADTFAALIQAADLEANETNGANDG